MARILSKQDILNVLDSTDPISAIEEGFAAYSAGRAVVPPVGELIFEDPPGETHIKYGYIKGDEHYVIKVGCGFYDNVKIGLPSRNGIMIVLSQKTGEIDYIMDDQGLLTDERTGAAGGFVAKYLAPAKVNRIGIVGAGGEGRVQAKYLRGIIDCDELLVWGLNEAELGLYINDVSKYGFNVSGTLNIEDITDTCNYIVTVTPSDKPLISAGMVKPGTHISAFGSDTPEKVELDSTVLQKADLLYVDSRVQSQERGEVFHARNSGHLDEKRLHELGELPLGKAPRRDNDEQITIADLTGIAVQDVQICKVVIDALD